MEVEKTFTTTPIYNMMIERDFPLISNIPKAIALSHIESTDRYVVRRNNEAVAYILFFTRDGKRYVDVVCNTKSEGKWFCKSVISVFNTELVTQDLYSETRSPEVVGKLKRIGYDFVSSDGEWELYKINREVFKEKWRL